MGLLVWTGVAATFPPWAPQAPCEGASINVLDASPSSRGQEGAVLDVSVENTTDGTITIPAGRDVIAKGVRGLGLPLTACRMTSATVPVEFGG